MKTIGILLMGILISCSVSKKSEQPINNIMQDEEKDDIEVKIIKDTATWVDGKIYQFIKVSVNIKLTPVKIIDINSIKQYAWGSGIIFISFGDLNFSDTTIRLNPIMMLSDEKGLFLLDDFDNHNKATVSVLYSKMYSINNSSIWHKDFFIQTVEVNFEEIRNTKFPDIYPEADSAWYKKWKEENPDFKGERERYEKRK